MKLIGIGGVGPGISLLMQKTGCGGPLEIEASSASAVYADDAVRNCQQVLLDDVGLIADGQRRVSWSR